MDDGTALAEAIGGRVRRERQAQRWSLDQLAAAADVSRRMLINIEQGTSNPSIGILLKISGALGVGLPALVEPPRPVSLVRVTRGDGPVLWEGASGGRAVLVASSEAPDVAELWDWRLAAGERHSSEAHSTGTRELLQVLHGVLDLEVADSTTRLEPGDAAAFPGDVPHAYVNAGSDVSRFSLAVFEPVVGRPRSSGGTRA